MEIKRKILKFVKMRKIDRYKSLHEYLQDFIEKNFHLKANNFKKTAKITIKLEQNAVTFECKPSCHSSQPLRAMQ